MSDNFEVYLFDDKFNKQLWKRCMNLTLDEENAEDLFQETLTKALESKDNFLSKNRNKPAYKSLDLEKWTYTICRNTYFDAKDRETFKVEITDKFEKEAEAAKKKGKTKKRIRREVPMEDDLVIQQDDSGQETSSLLQDIIRCMKRLNLIERETISLSEDLSYREISEILNISEGNSRVIVCRAREKMLACLEIEA
tara:strand:+ start:574 stop:1161 length:588 start_codon:yes stop_codon:yes gene_type:complete